MKRIAVGVVVGVLFPCMLSAQSRFALTPERLAIAIADPRGPMLGLSVALAKVNRNDNRVFVDFRGDPRGISSVSELKDQLFVIYVVTPYSRAAFAAGEARSTYKPVPAMSAETLNADGIIVSVEGSSNFLEAESVANVVLSLDNGRRIIQPTRTALAPRTISNALGAQRTITLGGFFFKFEDFDRLPLTLICISASGQTVKLWIDEDDLPR